MLFAPKEVQENPTRTHGKLLIGKIQFPTEPTSYSASVAVATLESWRHFFFLKYVKQSILGKAAFPPQIDIYNVFKQASLLNCNCSGVSLKKGNAQEKHPKFGGARK